jgi:hypothetical protein
MAHGESHSPRSWYITHRTSRHKLCIDLLNTLPTPEVAGAVGDCASRNDGVSAGIEASSVAALTSLRGDWSGAAVM